MNKKRIQNNIFLAGAIRQLHNILRRQTQQGHSLEGDTNEFFKVEIPMIQEEENKEGNGLEKNRNWQ